MCPQERSSLISIATNLLVNAVILVRLRHLFLAGALDGSDAPMVWARTVVWAVPAAFALVILLHIAFAVATRGDGTGPSSDERDKLFQVRGMIVSMVTFSLGLIGALIGLANGWAPLTGFLVIYYAASFGDVLGNGTRIACYRMGS